VCALRSPALLLCYLVFLIQIIPHQSTICFWPYAVRIVTTHQKAGGLVQNFQKGLQNRLGLGTVLTRRGQNWNVGNIYTASGIQTQHGERWRVREVVPYGYCNGDSETARARGLICEGVIIEQGANDSGQINEDIRNCFSRNEVGNLENLLARTNYLDLSGLKLRKEQIQILTGVLRNGKRS
jgi:hypothetical protein